MNKKTLYWTWVSLFISCCLSVSILTRMTYFWRRSLFIQSLLAGILVLTMGWIIYKYLSYCKELDSSDKHSMMMGEISLLFVGLILGMLILSWKIPASFPPITQEIQIETQHDNPDGEVVLLEVQLPDGQKIPPFLFFKHQGEWIEGSAYGYQNVLRTQDMNNAKLSYQFAEHIDENVKFLFYAGPQGGVVKTRLNFQTKKINLSEDIAGEVQVELKTNSFLIKATLFIADAVSLLILFLLAFNIKSIFSIIYSFMISIGEKIENFMIVLLPIQRFWLKFGIIAIVIGLVNLLLFLAYLSVSQPYYEKGYPAGMEDKHARLESISEPKIILVGDSNLTLGVDSERIQSELIMPVVNMGLFGSLGIEFNLREILNNVNPGDIVVLSFANTNEQISFPEEAPATWYLVFRAYPKMLYYLPLTQQVALVEEFFYRHPMEIQRLRTHFYDNWDWNYAGPVYNRASFNEQGDLLGHLEYDYQGDSTDVIPVSIKLGIGTDKFISALNEFNTEIKSRGGTAYYMFAPFPEELYETNSQQFFNAYQNMAENCTIPILGKPENFIYPLEDFYDSYNHLNRNGRQKRTDVMISLLRPVIGDLENSQ